MIGNKEEVAIELLRSNFDLVKDSMKDIKVNIELVARRIDSAKSEMEADIKPSIRELSANYERIRAELASITKLTHKFQAMFYAAGILFFLFSGINKLGAGKLVAALLGWG
jgi:archaellum component FlaC